MKINEGILQNLVKQTFQEEDDDELLLNQYGYNLVLKASNKELNTIIGRNSELQKIIQILCKRQKNNPILIGHSGVGKTAILEGLANWIAEEKVPTELLNKKIYVLDYALLISKSTYKGQFEGIVHRIINKLKQDGNYILFIDEIHIILTPQKIDNSLDLANLLKPILARGELPVIGATTILEYKKFIMADPAFQRRFNPIFIEEMSVENTVNLLRETKSSLEKYYNVKIENDVLELIVDATNKYLPTQYLPDKAIDILENICSSVNINIKSPDLYLLKEKQKLEFLKQEYERDPNNIELKNTLKLKHQVILDQTQICQRLNIINKELKEQYNNLDDLEQQLLLFEKNLEYNKAADVKHIKIPKILEKITKLEQELGEITPLKNSIDNTNIKELLSEYIPLNAENMLLKQQDVYHLFQKIEKNLELNDFIFYNELKELLNTLMVEKLKRIKNDKTIYIVLSSPDIFIGKYLITQACKLLNTSDPMYILINLMILFKFHSTNNLENGILSYLGEISYENELEDQLETNFILHTEDLNNLLKHNFLISKNNILEENGLNKSIVFILTQNLDNDCENNLYKLGITNIIKIQEKNINIKLDLFSKELTNYLQEFNCFCSNILIFAKYIFKKYEKFNNNLQEMLNFGINIIKKNLGNLLLKNQNQEIIYIKFNQVFNIFEIEKLIGNNH